MILFIRGSCLLRVKNADKDEAQIRAVAPHCIYQVVVTSYWISMHSLADISFQCYPGKTVKTEPEVDQAQESPVQLKKAVSKPAKKSRTAVSTKAVKRERDAQGLDDSAGEELQTEGRPSVKPKQKPVKSNAEQQTETDDKGNLAQAQDQPKTKRKRAASEGGNGNGASASATNAVTNVRPHTTRQLLRFSPCLHCIAFCRNLDSRFHTLISWRNANS